MAGVSGGMVDAVFMVGKNGNGYVGVQAAGGVTASSMMIFCVLVWRWRVGTRAIWARAKTRQGNVMNDGRAGLCARARATKVGRSG